MKYKAAVFDLDGTLLDTLEDLADSCNAALRRFALATHPTEAYRYLVGGGTDALMRRVAPNGDTSLWAKLLEAMLDEYAQRWAEKTRPYEGVREMLSELAARGTVMAVLSNKPHEFTCLCVDRLLDGCDFAIVQGLDENTPPKPDPSGAVRIAGRLGLAPEEFLYLGDTNTDMRTAVAAGMFAVGACWGFRPRKELADAGAAALVDHPRELLDLFDRRV